MKRSNLLLLAVLLIATALAYLPAYRAGFIWDDDRYVTGNALLHDVDGLKRIWLEVGATPQYYPLTHTSFWLDYQVGGLNPLGYHVTNVVLHAIAALLIVWLLTRVRVPGAWLAGFVFALHPLHVESVAWVTERKNVLSMVFLLAAVIAYPTEVGANPSRRRYVGALLLFIGAVLSKTVACVMPAAVLVLIWWQRGRITRRDWLPLVPFFAIALAAAGLTSWMERAVVGAEGDDWSLGFAERTLVAGRALWWYAGKVLLPADLAFSYERWTVDPRSVLQWAYVIGAIALVAVLWRMRHRWGRGPLAAVLIFGGTLFPALGFFNLFPHRYSFVADHFQYHANVALIALLCALVARWWEVVAVVLPVLGAMTFLQARIYHDPETLWRDTIAQTPTSWLAHHNLAAELTMEPTTTERLEEAVRLAERTTQLRPQHESADWTRGNALWRLGRRDEALAAYERSVSLHRKLIAAYPLSGKPYQQLARLLDRIDRHDEALAVLCAGSDARRDICEFAQGASIRLIESKQLSRAIPYLERWCELQPRSFEARLNLGYAYGSAGQFFDARRAFLQAKEIDPAHPGVADGLQKVERSLRSAPPTAPRSAAGTQPG